MTKYIVWLTTKSSDYKPFYDIVFAKDLQHAKETIKHNKAYSDIKILEIKKCSF